MEADEVLVHRSSAGLLCPVVGGWLLLGVVVRGLLVGGCCWGCCWGVVVGGLLGGCWEWCC